MALSDEELKQRNRMYAKKYYQQRKEQLSKKYYDNKQESIDDSNDDKKPLTEEEKKAKRSATRKKYYELHKEEILKKYHDNKTTPNSIKTNIPRDGNNYFKRQQAELKELREFKKNKEILNE
jgi:hypothetical protein